MSNEKHLAVESTSEQKIIVGEKEYSPQEMWGFAFQAVIEKAIAPNGFARLNPLSPHRIVRSKVLYKQQVDEAISHAIQQHNLYLEKMFNLVSDNAQQSYFAIQQNEKNIKKLRFWERKRKQAIIADTIRAKACLESFKDVLNLMQTIKPSNVTTKPN